MNNITIKGMGAMVIALLIAFSACDQAVELASQSADQETAADEATLENELDELFRTSQEAMDVTSDGGRVAEESYCATRIVDRASRTIVLDFGEDGCIGPDGRTRSGRITITYEGILVRSRVAARTIVFDSYAVDGRSISGSISVSGASQNNDGQWEFTRSADVAVSFEDGTAFTHQNSKTMAWVAGFGDGDYFNDAFEVTGNGSGINRNGVSYSMNIDDPLVRKTECTPTSGRGFPVSGVKSFTLTSEGATRSFSVDYGDGTCDRMVEVTFGDGTVRTVEVGD